MKLNPDCIRDILMTLEEHTGFNTIIRISSDMLGLEEKYSYEEIRYHLRQCDWSGMVVDLSLNLSGDCTIRDISPKGHEFIANIRKDTVWNGVKSVAHKVGSTSLSALVQISSAVIAELIKSQFIINPYQTNV